MKAVQKCIKPDLVKIKGVSKSWLECAETHLEGGGGGYLKSDEILKIEKYTQTHVQYVQTYTIVRRRQVTPLLRRHD